MDNNERPTRVEIDCATGITTIIELTDEEIAERVAWAAQRDLEKEAQAAEQLAIDTLKASAKAKLVAGKPLTDEEASTIVI